MKKLRDPEEPLERFFGIFGPMKRQMGPVLIQLPRMLGFNYEVAANCFKLLKKQYRQFQFVLEVRHPTWLRDDALALLSEYGIGLVISQSGDRFPYSEMITAQNIYVRFHGPAELYASPYSDEDLKFFAKKFKTWVKKGHEIWAFFNNDIHGYAPVDAMRLRKYCGV